MRSPRSPVRLACSSGTTTGTPCSTASPRRMARAARGSRSSVAGLLRSSGDAAGSRQCFEEAASEAQRSGSEELHVDALHMVALVVPADERLVAHRTALRCARAAEDPAARDWDASLLNNIGMEHADAGDHAAALAAFKEALEARERIGDPARTRVARWMVAWSLRHLGVTDLAREMQLALKAELDAIGQHDPYVDEELALLAEQAIVRTGGAPLIGGNVVRILRDSTDNYPAWLDAIAAARQRM